MKFTLTNKSNKMPTKFSKKFYSLRSNHQKHYKAHPSREYLWGIYIDHEYYNEMSFEYFCKNQLTL